MLNEKIMLVFDAAMKYLVAGESVVVPKSDIREALGTDFTQAEIDGSLNALQMNELLQIRYADSEVYCLSLQPKGVWENEKREELKAAERRRAELAAAEEAKRAALAAEDEEKKAQTPPEKEEEEVKPESAQPPVGEKQVYVPVPTSPVNLAKAAIICGISSFLGAFLAGIITMIVVIAKVG